MAILNADYSGLNFDDMAANIGLKPKHIPMLIGSFLEESTPILSSLEAAIASKDFSGIKLQAHSIKGSSGNLKFTEIYEMSREMESAAAESNEGFDYSSYLKAIAEAVKTIPN